MTRYIVTYGVIAGAIAISVLVAGLVFDTSNHTSSLWFGYLVMLLAMSLILVAVKRYRDVECGGVIRFSLAFGLGVAIAAVAGLIYVAGWELYLAMTGWDYMAGYSASILDGMRAEGASPAAIAAESAKMQAMAESYKNPLVRVPMTFAEIFPVGLLVALVTAAVLRDPRALPARA